MTCGWYGHCLWPILSVADIFVADIVYPRRNHHVQRFNQVLRRYWNGFDTFSCARAHSWTFAGICCVVEHFHDLLLRLFSDALSRSWDGCRWLDWRSTCKIPTAIDQCTSRDDDFCASLIAAAASTITADNTRQSAAPILTSFCSSL